MYETRISYTLDWLKNLASAGADRENDKWNVFLPTRIHEYPEMSSISRLAESLQCRINSATSRNSGNVPSSDHSWYKNAYTVTFTYTSPTTTASNDDSPNTLSSSGQSWKSAEKNGRWFRWSDELSHWKVIVPTLDTRISIPTRTRKHRTEPRIEHRRRTLKSRGCEIDHRRSNCSQH